MTKTARFAFALLTGLGVSVVVAQAQCPPLITGTPSQCSTLNAGACNITPAKLEVNLGPFPVDKYLACNKRPDGTPILPSCPTEWTVRQCIRSFFNNNPNVWPYNYMGRPNFRGQAVTGVRFFFDLWGGEFSTPFETDANWNYLRISDSWRRKLGYFFADLKSYGIQNISPTPGTVASFAYNCGRPNCDRTEMTCGTPQSLRFYRWLPFGVSPDFNQFPDQLGGNNAYNCANANPDFWGWTPWLAVIETVLSLAQQKELNVADLDLQNELDLMNFTVMARLIYDNKHNLDGTPGAFDVLGQVRQLMKTAGFGDCAPPAPQLPDCRVTFSTQAIKPTPLPADDPPRDRFDCGSVYGDSAMLLYQSELTAALGGAAFGYPLNPSPQNGLLCLGSTEGMIPYLPMTYTQPTVTNVHFYACLTDPNPPNPDVPRCLPNEPVTNLAKNFYNDVYVFLHCRGLTGNYVMFGETNWTHEPQCGDLPKVRAFDNVNGFMSSSLYGRANTVLRVWENQTDGCFVLPWTLNPPYKP